MITVGDLHIDPIDPKDAWNLCDFVVSNEDRLERYLPKTMAQNLTPTLSESFVSMKALLFKTGQEYLFTLRHAGNRSIIGLVYIKNIDQKNKEGELAYCIGYQYEKKGLMTKAVSALSSHALNALGLDTLKIITHRSNAGSIKVAENCGYSWVKTLHSEFTPTNGKPLDMELYEIYNER